MEKEDQPKQKVIIVKLVERHGILYVYDPKKKRIKLKFCVLRGLFCCVVEAVDKIV